MINIALQNTGTIFLNYGTFSVIILCVSYLFFSVQFSVETNHLASVFPISTNLVYMPRSAMSVNCVASHWWHSNDVIMRPVLSQLHRTITLRSCFGNKGRPPLAVMEQWKRAPQLWRTNPSPDINHWLSLTTRSAHICASHIYVLPTARSKYPTYWSCVILNLYVMTV